MVESLSYHLPSIAATLVGRQHPNHQLRGIFTAGLKRRSPANRRGRDAGSIDSRFIRQTLDDGLKEAG
jgi:hypothetical protein